MNFNCDRCRVKITEVTEETLVFESQYKKTKLSLCPACFESAREVFNNWKENSEDGRNNSTVSEGSD